MTFDLNLPGNPMWVMETGGRRDPVRFFGIDGSEYFMAVLQAKCPAINDTLRVMGIGRTRAEAREQTRENWGAAWHSLNTKSRV